MQLHLPVAREMQAVLLCRSLKADASSGGYAKEPT
jgi:hypothetical protein